MNLDSIDVLQKNSLLLSSLEQTDFRYIPQHDKPLPSLPKLKRIVDLLRAAVFPGYFGDSIVNLKTLECHIGVTLEELYSLLSEQIYHGLCFDHSENGDSDYKKLASKTALALIDRLPEIKRIISTDVKATFDGDPAARSYGEVIFSYPNIRAVFNHRIAHELLKLGVPVIPRTISELAHSDTGIDIHPGAQIGEYFSIDHGTGVVIGETCIIGKHVRLYQGVTLGAKRFTLDQNGNPINIPRHPILEDNVVVYANANILGRITIGHDSVIGGNVWLTNDVPPETRILQQKVVVDSFYNGLGI